MTRKEILIREWKTIHSYTSRNMQKQWREFVKEFIEELQNDCEYTFLDVYVEGKWGRLPGVICFDENGKKIYQEIPRNDDYEERILKAILEDGNYRGNKW